MTPEQREELKQAAMAAKGWNWNAIQGDQFGRQEDGSFYDIGTVDADQYSQGGEGEDDYNGTILRFIAKSDPTAILSLIAQVEVLTVPQPLSEPNQPVILDAHGTQRFRANALVQHLLDNNGGAHIGVNELHEIDCPDADREQFAQLIGYSVSGWGTLSYVSEERWDAVQAAIDAAPTIPAIPGTKEGA